MSLAYGDPDIKANAMTGRPGPHIMYMYMPEDFKAKTAPPGLEKTHTLAAFSRLHIAVDGSSVYLPCQYRITICDCHIAYDGNYVISNSYCL